VTSLKKNCGFIQYICPNVKTNPYLCRLMRFLKTTTNSTLNIMKQTNIILCGSSYESPAVRLLDIMSEGVLCASGEFSIGDWENDDESLDF
jgi:hypothetical protein